VIRGAIDGDVRLATRSLNGASSISMYQARWYEHDEHVWSLNPRRYGQLELSISMADCHSGEAGADGRSTCGLSI
jgi:hypothetical protein